MTSSYGPLINLSEASNHMGHFVQLLVFVHRSTPVQYKLSKGGEIIRTDIQVGDDTRPFFSVSLWKKELRSIVAAGDIVLLRSAIELVAECRMGIVVKEKLSKVIEWVQRTGYIAIDNIEPNDCQKRRLSRNWKVPEPNKFRECPSLSEETI
ncbi:hypothetical protein V6Z11_D05G248000 [Gossypium hirsutum]